MNTRKKTVTITTIVGLLLILLYAFFNARLLIEGPKIIIHSPENGLSFESPFIEIRGEAHNTAFITMNGHPIFVNENSEFKEKLLLPSGTSIIKLEARDRFERTTETTLWYTYKNIRPEPVFETVYDSVIASTTASTTIETYSTSSSVE